MNSVGGRDEKIRTLRPKFPDQLYLPWIALSMGVSMCEDKDEQGIE